MNSTAKNRRLRGGASPLLSPRRLGAAVALAAIVLGATACSSSSSGTTTTSAASTTSTSAASTTSTSAASTTSTSAASTTSTSAPAGGSASLTQVEAKLDAGLTATFVASYSFESTPTTGTATKGTFTLAHEGSNSLVAFDESSGSFEEIVSATSSVICSKSASGWECFSGSAGAEEAASITALSDLYGTKGALAALKAAVGGTASPSTVAGQTCIAFHETTESGTVTVCVNANGVFSEMKAQTSTETEQVKLTSYSSSVPSNEFTPPATPTTLPS